MQWAGGGLTYWCGCICAEIGRDRAWPGADPVMLVMRTLLPLCHCSEGLLVQHTVTGPGTSSSTQLTSYQLASYEPGSIVKSCHASWNMPSRSSYAFCAFYALGVLFSVIGGPCKRYAVTLTRMPSQDCLQGPRSRSRSRYIYFSNAS
jgi:hypothetical protein